MYFEQFYLGCLAHASYMIGSEGTAAVVDPQRDVQLYLDEAARHGLEIRHVIETHLHADFVSGHNELAERTGASIYLGQGSGADFPHVAVKDGDEIAFGACRLGFIATPGHTVESISVLVTDIERSPAPFGALTGDTLFIGDVGRPDLSRDLTPQELAGMLYDSIYGKLLKLPGSIEIYPAHGAGSLCGRQISSEKVSTLGRELVTNPALRARDREEFIRMVTEDLPARPGYFLEDAEMNRHGALPLDGLPALAMLPSSRVRKLVSAEVMILDTRPAADFAEGHISGSIHIALQGQFASWAGRVVGLRQRLILVVSNPRAAIEARIRLARVGIEHVDGYLSTAGEEWAGAGTLAKLKQISVEELHRRKAEGENGLCVIDVREPGERKAGYIEGSVHYPLGSLRERLGELNPERTLAVYCKGGYRSSIAASLLARGRCRALNVTGGFDAWLAAGLPASAH